jgi:hypothetical protein
MSSLKQGTKGEPHVLVEEEALWRRPSPRRRRPPVATASGRRQQL